MITLIHNSNWSFCLVFTLFIHFSSLDDWMMELKNCLCAAPPERMRRTAGCSLNGNVEIYVSIYAIHLPWGRTPSSGASCFCHKPTSASARLDEEHPSALSERCGSICFINQALLCVFLLLPGSGTIQLINR